MQTPERHRAVVAALTYECSDAKWLFSHGLAKLRTMRHDSTDAVATMSLLALGAEKLLKLTIGIARLGQGQDWPDKTYMQRRLGHRILIADRDARAALTTSPGTAPGHLASLKAAVDADPIIPLVLEALNRFGDAGRFYYLDVLADNQQTLLAPAALWAQAIDEVLSQRPDVTSAISHQSTYESGRGALNGLIAESLQRWWEMYRAAWRTGVLGNLGKRWSSELELETPPIV